MKNIITQGNYVRTSVFAGNGCMQVEIGLKDDAEDETRVEYEDNLYKVYKNDELVMAATSCLIKVIDNPKR